MADTVQVNGVTLTREQVEKALTELNTPKFKAGDIVRWNKPVGPRQEAQRFVVLLGGSVERMLRKEYPYGSSEYLHVTDGIESWSNPVENFVKVGQLA